jgi:glycosyltransferase involved in cell wall biosynthesis
MRNNYVFFTDALGAGGISTNVTALASYMGASKAEVIIVALSLRRYSVSVWEYCQKFANIMSVLNFIIYIIRSKPDSYVFFVNGFKTLLTAYFILLLSFFKRHSVKIVFTVYHPAEFSHGGYWCRIYRQLICSLGKENIYFMNGACYIAHEKVCRRGSIARNYLPLVFPRLDDISSESVVKTRKSILTVGRFVGFKMHYMRALLQYALVKPEYDFYFAGNGDGEVELKTYIEVNNMNNVYFLGAVDYAKLHSLYLDTTCYVGMGTTLIEASSLGKPSVVAIVGVPGDVCYGLFIDQLEFDMGEYRVDKPMRSMAECLDGILSLSEASLSDLGDRHRVFSEQFRVEVVGAIYLELSNSSSATKIKFKVLIQLIYFVIISLFCAMIWRVFGNESRYDQANA